MFNEEWTERQIAVSRGHVQTAHAVQLIGSDIWIVNWDATIICQGGMKERKARKRRVGAVEAGAEAESQWFSRGIFLRVLFERVPQAYAELLRHTSGKPLHSADSWARKFNLLPPDRLSTEEYLRSEWLQVWATMSLHKIAAGRLKDPWCIVSNDWLATVRREIERARAARFRRVRRASNPSSPVETGPGSEQHEVARERAHWQAGHIPITAPRWIQLRAEWLVLHVVRRWTLEAIAEEYQEADRRLSIEAVGNGVRETAALIGLALPKTPGRP